MQGGGSLIPCCSRVTCIHQKHIYVYINTCIPMQIHAKAHGCVNVHMFVYVYRHAYIYVAQSLCMYLYTVTIQFTI